MSSDSNVYEERLSLGPWTTISFFLIIAMLSTSTIFQVFRGFPEGGTTLTLFLLGFDLLFMFLFLNFRKLVININPKRIKATFGLIKKVISVQDIESCEPIRASFGLYGGYGIRYGGDGSQAFTVSFGNAIKIRLKSGRPFVVSTNRQKEVLNLLNSLIEQSI